MSRVRQAGFVLANDISFKYQGCAAGVQLSEGFLLCPLLITSLPKFPSSTGFVYKENEESSQ